MRKTMTLLLAGAVGLGAASLANAVTWNGLMGDPDCAAEADTVGLDAELYAFKIKSDESGYTDLLSDLRMKPGSMGNVGGADVSSPPAFNVSNNFQQPEAPDDVAFIFVTFSDGTLAYNSGEAGTSGGDLLFNVQMPIGVSWPAAAGGATPLTPSTFAGSPGIQFNWGIFPEVAGPSPTFGVVDCHVSGLAFDPNTSGGLFSGYNVYRLPGATAPTATDYYNETITPTMDHDGDTTPDPAFQYFAPIGAFDFSVGDTGGGGGDPDPTGDLVGLNNPDAAVFTGDEEGVFQDDPGAQRGGRLAGTVPPVVGTTYWYAVQPVVGRADDNSVGIPQLVGVALGPIGAWTVAGVDLTGDGTDDSADIDGDGTIEFFSPQADFGIGGLGLTHGSIPLMSAPVSLDFAALGVGGEIDFSGEYGGGDVELEFTTAQEMGNVLGFNVFRHHGDVRVPVNADLIAAHGGEGSVYRLVDDLGQLSRRMRRGSSFEYSVDVVFSDGTPTETVGPFSVTIGNADTRENPTRRQRR